MYWHGIVQSQWIEESMLLVASVWESLSRLLGMVVPSGERKSSAVDLGKKGGDLFPNYGLAWVRDDSGTLRDDCEGYMMMGASYPVTQVQIFPI